MDCLHIFYDDRKLKCSKYDLESIFYNMHSESFPQSVTSTAPELPTGIGGSTIYLCRFHPAQEKLPPSMTQRTENPQIPPFFFFFFPSRHSQISIFCIYSKYLCWRWRLRPVRGEWSREGRWRRRGCEGREGSCEGKMGSWGKNWDMKREGGLWGENGAVRGGSCEGRWQR